MTKQVLFSDEAREKLKKGVNIVADAVGQTLGAKGQNVILDKGMFPPLITNDGVTIAKDIELKDRFEHMGASIIKEAASNTNEVAGDGTTTATVLAQAMINEGFKNIAAGANPMILRKGIEAATRDLIEELRKMKKPVGKDDIENVATISSGDEEVGKAIAEAMEKVGTDGVITVEEGHKIGLETVVVEGMQFDNGLISPYLSTDIPKMEAVMLNAPILITDKRISHVSQFSTLVDALIKQGHKALTVIAEDVDGEALQVMVLNNVQQKFQFIAVRAPGFGERRGDYLQDIATLTGGHVISANMGLSLEKCEPDMLGTAVKIIANQKTTTIVSGGGKKDKIELQAQQIRNQIDSAATDYDKDKLKDRLGKLIGGVGVIKVGAPTESEMKEKKLRIEDALNATKAATDKEDGGILAGGGSSLAKAGQKLQVPQDKSEDFKTGYQIVKYASSYPLWKIADNAGDKGDVVVKEITVAKGTIGYDAITGEYVDMLESGIIDPLKVTVTALKNAASAAQMLLTTGCIVVEDTTK